MAGFEGFVSSELPKRPFTSEDGPPGYVLARSSNPLATRECEWVPMSGGTFSLITSSKTALVNNRLKLLYKPQGGLLFNMMMVYVQGGVMFEFNDVTVEEDAGTFYAVLNEPDTVTGEGVVSYLIELPQ